MYKRYFYFCLVFSLLYRHLLFRASSLSFELARSLSSTAFLSFSLCLSLVSYPGISGLTSQKRSVGSFPLSSLQILSESSRVFLPDSQGRLSIFPGKIPKAIDIWQMVNEQLETDILT
ncbi:hypothetical protein AAMO2058_001357200 [Amorphochlora amoebiformis]